MQINSNVNDINKQLKIYGSNIYTEPNFRIVFSDDQTENRHGTYKDFSGDIFIREVREVREVKKYPWIKERWILERWASGETAKHHDLASIKSGVYVCVYVFQDKDKNYLPPLWIVCKILIDALLNPRRKADALCEDKEIESKQEEKEVNEIQTELMIESDLKRVKDMHSKKDSISEGYSEKELV